MRAHILILSFVGYSVAVSDRPRPRAERPISNVQFLVPLTPRWPLPASPASPAAPATPDKVQVAQWLLRALQRYLQEHNALALDPLDQLDQVATISIEKIDDDDSSSEGADDDGDEPPPLPMLPLVEPAAAARPDVTFEQFKRIAEKLVEARQRHRAAQPAAGELRPLGGQPRLAHERDSQPAPRAPDTHAVLVDEVRDDSPQQRATVGSAHSALHSHLHSHTRVLPRELQERVALQAHVQGAHSCAWCALLRPRSSPPPPPHRAPSLAGLQWFGPVSARRDRHVIHEEYPGMMNYYINYIVNRRQKKLRGHLGENENEE